jgi:hypothetical protein
MNQLISDIVGILHIDLAIAYYLNSKDILIIMNLHIKHIKHFALMMKLLHFQQGIFNSIYNRYPTCVIITLFP